MKFVCRKLIVAGLTMICLTGCWDRVEINEMAIVGLVGSEMDKKTQEQIVYYQIVNPEAFSSGSANGGSPVYTYIFRNKTKGGIGQKSSYMLPRKLFTDHYQSHIVTEDYAKEGLRSFLNYYERQFNRRSSLYLFITDSTLSEVMKTYTPLEKLPGRLLRSLIHNTHKATGQISLKSRVKDLVENLESSKITAMPIVSLKGTKPDHTTGRFENIDVSESNLILTGAALFKKDRMVGKISLWENGYYNILKGEAETFFQTIDINGRFVDLYANKVKTKQHLSLVNGEPLWNVEVNAHLAIRNNNQKEKLNWENVSQITKQFNQQIIVTSNKLYMKAIDNKWDMFGLGDMIKYKRGRDWKPLQKQDEAWLQTKLQLTVRSTIDDIGEIIDPFKEGEGNGAE
ncbi:Ger(x)C family spore germination protein [Paenibacillus taichungensis]|uniref:Ger(x)C family spore germination protein n=1 Tax=Paenibacillus taichungensis TaxID=484184 RepID=UPI0035D6BD6E